jgi:hypothetical protein
MTVREKRQREFADNFVNRPSTNANGWPQEVGGILYLCPRFGKCRVGVHVLNTLKPDAHVLIAYPNVTIKKSWEEEFEKMGYSNPNIKFTTHLSLHKWAKVDWDLIILDEIHLLSEAQLLAVSQLRGEILGLTGTMTSWTQRVLRNDLGLHVIAEYPIEKAIEEGVITDYRIKVKRVPLDNNIRQDYKGKRRTEKQQFDMYGNMIRKLENEKRDTMFMRLARMRVIQNSVAKQRATQRLLEEFEKERVLVFCGVTAIADNLGCPVYHSKSGEKETFEAFASGKGNHLAVVKLGNTGVTYKPLHKVIINYFDSNAENLCQKINRCMAMEYDTPNKMAEIWIVCSTEEVEQRWLQKALEFFDPLKVEYV